MTGTGNTRPVLCWFIRDLRLADNPALTAAAESGCPVIPVLIVDNSQPGPPVGTARAWSALNTAALDTALCDRYGSRLVIRRGDLISELGRIIAETNVAAVYYNSIPEPWFTDLETRLARDSSAVDFHRSPGNLLIEPGSVLTKDNRPYRVFTPFHRRFREVYRHVPPLPVPELLPAPDTLPGGDDPAALLDGNASDAVAAARRWTPGEAAAAEKLAAYIDTRLGDYADDRDRLDIPATSELSPYLAAGVLSARTVWDAIDSAGIDGESGAAFLRQLAWREFSYDLLAGHPDLAIEPYRPAFRDFPWVDNPGWLERWCEGETGYPVVDAAMRQLRATGYIPGRGRMVAASFLTKHLRQDWRAGERWFRERLVDFDPALNAFNWQWVMGCGADAAPYFRIFNPVLQGRKFDPAGAYVRRWVPELTALPGRWVQAPWEAPAVELAAAGIELGRHYPAPVVDHRTAREQALGAYRSLTGDPGK